MEAIDPIPVDCTLLDEVIDLVYMATTPDAGEISGRIDVLKNDEERDAALDEYDLKSAASISILLNHLKNGHLRALIREPGTGALLQLSLQDWDIGPAYVQSGTMWRLFLRPHASFLKGAWRRIFFKDSDVQSFFATHYPSFALHRRGQVSKTTAAQDAVTALDPVRKLGDRPASGPAQQRAWDAITKYFPNGFSINWSAETIAHELKKRVVEENPASASIYKDRDPYNSASIRRLLAGD